MNNCSFVGNAGRDPEVRYFEDGKVVANFSIAVKRRKRDAEPLWLKLEIWGKQAQVAADYVRKGSLVGVAGELDIDEWTDRNTGEPRKAPKLRVNDLRLLGSKSDNQQSSAPTNSGWGGGSPSDEEAPF